MLESSSSVAMFTPYRMVKSFRPLHLIFQEEVLLSVMVAMTAVWRVPKTFVIAAKIRYDRYFTATFSCIRSFFIAKAISNYCKTQIRTGI